MSDIGWIVTGSPAKRPSLFCRSAHSSPEHKHKPPALPVNKTKDSKGSFDRDDIDVTTSENYLQISKTKELPQDQVSAFTWNVFISYSDCLLILHMQLIPWFRSFLRGNTCSARQEIPHLVWKVKVHFCVHKTSLLVCNLSHSNPVHTFHPNHLPLFTWVFQVVKNDKIWSIFFLGGGLGQILR